MARYLLTVNAENTERLERMLSGRITVLPSYGPLESAPGAMVAGLDAITDDEYEVIAQRLRNSGPLYHAGGPHGGA